MTKTYGSLFVEIGKYAVITAFVVMTIVTSAAIASSPSMKTSNEAPLKATGVQLAITSPAVNVCPAKAKMAGFIMTTKPGTVEYMIAKKDGGISGPFVAEAVDSVQGGMASFNRDLEINHPVDGAYRLLVAGTDGEVLSDWVPLKASCNMSLAAK